MLLPLLAALGIAVLWQQARQGGSTLLGFFLQWPGLLLAGFVGLLCLQLAPLGGQAITVSPGRTLNYLTVALACATAAWLARSLVRSSRDVRRLLLTLVISGGLQAVLAVLLLASGNSLTVVETTLGDEPVATGSFPNRNHLAAYLNLCLSAGAGLLLGGLKSFGSERNWRQTLRSWLNLVLSDKARIRLVMVAMVIALILTRSRMGNASFFFGLMVTALLFGALTRGNRTGLFLFIASILIIDTVLIGAWIGLDRVVERLEGTAISRSAPSQDPNQALKAAAGEAQTKEASSTDPTGTEAAASPPPREESIEARVDPALEGIGIVREHPWLGTGGGTFLLSFMAHAKDDKGSFYDHAHNDYIEIAADTGLLGLGLLAGYALSAFVASLRLLAKRQNPAVRAAAVALVMGAACMAVHLTVEFPLQIPAYAITFTVLATLPFAAQAIPSQRRRKASSVVIPVAGPVAQPVSQPAPPLLARWSVLQGRPAALAAVVAGTLALGFMASHALREGMANTRARQAYALLPTTEAEGQAISPAVANEALARLQDARAWSPTHPSIDDMIGSLLVSRAQLPKATAANRKADLEAAAQSYRQAIAGARTSPASWGNLVLVKQELAQFDDEFKSALRQAAAFGPYQPSVQVIVLSGALAAWPNLSAEDRQLASATIERGWATNAQALADEARAAPNQDQWCAAAVTAESLPLRALCSAVRQ